MFFQTLLSKIDAQQNFFDLHIQFYEIFQAQDPESEDLDVIFEIGGKKLYANKSRLTVVSPTFKSMLSDRWISKNDEPIQINEYKFEDFEEFLSFIYSGESKLNDDNIFDMIDMTEFFGVQIFKNICQNYLAIMQITFDNIFPLIELSNKYSLVGVKNSMQTFVVENFKDFVKCEAFLDCNKSIITEIVTFVQNKIGQELIFQGIFEWAEYQAVKKQNESIQDSFNLNDAIKAEITPFLQYFQLKKMSLGFLVKYVVRKSFLFSGDELSNILDQKIPSFKVKVTNSLGQSLSCTLPYDSEAIENIKSVTKYPSDNMKTLTVYWEKEDEDAEMPSTPSPIKKRDGIEWYLTYDREGDVAVYPQKLIESDQYLIAEMIPESSGFKATEKSKIEIF